MSEHLAISSKTHFSKSGLLPFWKNPLCLDKQLARLTSLFNLFISHSTPMM